MIWAIRHGQIFWKHYLNLLVHKTPDFERALFTYSGTLSFDVQQSSSTWIHAAFESNLWMTYIIVCCLCPQYRSGNIWITAETAFRFDKTNAVAQFIRHCQCQRSFHCSQGHMLVYLSQWKRSAHVESFQRLVAPRFTSAYIVKIQFNFVSFFCCNAVYRNVF